MGDFKDRSDMIYDNLIKRLDEEGYDAIPTAKINQIVDLISDNQLEDTDAFEELVQEAIKVIND